MPYYIIETWVDSYNILQTGVLGPMSTEQLEAFAIEATKDGRPMLDRVDVELMTNESVWAIDKPWPWAVIEGRSVTADELAALGIKVCRAALEPT